MLQNELLKQAQAKLDEGVTNSDAYERIFKAAMQMVYNKDIFERISKGLDQSEDPVADVAKGVVSVISMLATRAQGKMPPDAAVQAGMALLLNGLDFLEQAGLTKIDNETLERAASEYVDSFLPALGLTPQKMEQAVKEVEGVMGDEEKMKQYTASREGVMATPKGEPT